MNQNKYKLFNHMKILMNIFIKEIKNSKIIEAYIYIYVVQRWYSWELQFLHWHMLYGTYRDKDEKKKISLEDEIKIRMY
jgi:hypothetical protein